jgi:hypothetical protein
MWTRFGFPVVLVILTVALAACGGGGAAKVNARNACLEEVARAAGTATDAVTLDGAANAVDLGDGWGFSGSVSGPSGNRMLVCSFTDGRAAVTLGDPAA